MSKKRIDIPDDLTSKMVGQPIVYTPPPIYESVVEAPAAKSMGGRPVKATSASRVKYTTAISKDLIRFLRVEAAQRDITPADLLETIISEYKNRG